MDGGNARTPMIQFPLACDDGHRFDAWFANSAAYDDQRARGLVTCAICGTVAVDKALMAPTVAPSGRAPTPLARLKAEVEAKSDYVGKGFAKEARAIHDGTAPERAIWGEATGADARRLIADGIPVAPLPFIPTRKTN